MTESIGRPPGQQVEPQELNDAAVLFPMSVDERLLQVLDLADELPSHDKT